MGFLDSLSKTLSSGVDRAKFEADKFQRTSRINGDINNVKSQIDTNIRQLGERALELYQQGAITAPEIASLAQIIAQLRDQLGQKETELTTVQNETFEAWQATQPQQSQTPPSQNIPISSDSSSNYGVGSSYSSPSGSSYSSPSGSSYSNPSSPSYSDPSSSGPSYSNPSSGGPLPTYTPSTPSYSSTPSTPSTPADTGLPSYTSRSYTVSESTDMSGSGQINSSSVGGEGSSGATTTACSSCGYQIPGNAAFCPNCGARIAAS